MRGSATLNGMLSNRETGPQVAYLIEAEPRAARLETTLHPGIAVFRLIWVIGKIKSGQSQFQTQPLGSETRQRPTEWLSVAVP